MMILQKPISNKLKDKIYKLEKTVALQVQQNEILNEELTEAQYAKEKAQELYNQVMQTFNSNEQETEENRKHNIQKVREVHEKEIDEIKKAHSEEVNRITEEK